MSDEEETLAAKKTKQMIARTYGKRNRKKSKLKSVVYGTYWCDEERNECQDSQATTLQQFKVRTYQSHNSSVSYIPSAHHLTESPALASK